jgi:RNA polymerase sigma factor (sigma-70 family)
MVSAQLGAVVRQLHAAEVADADLWARYVRQRDASAFETLVRRHGPMVLGVCRRILRNEQDAEDAFQATFLVLVRRAASLRAPGAIANWLHGVAHRTALEAKRAILQRRTKEALVPPRTEVPADPWAELRLVLDQELARLARRYRAVIILCDLEGKTRKEAAHQLGCAEGTVASRLARARRILAHRLTRRGFTSAVLALAGGAASARVPSRLVRSTVEVARFSVVEGAAVQVVPSARVSALTEGVLKSMVLTKFKSAVAMVLVIGIGALALLSRTGASEPAKPVPVAQKQKPAKSEDVHERVLELKQQLQQMQKQLAKLEEDTQPRRPVAPAASLADRFKHRVEFEIGHTETRDGGRIDIREVWGTRPKIEVGGQYLVRGKYVLPKGQSGKLYFYLTATTGTGEATTLDLQMLDVDKQEGEFTLVHGMAGAGYFHLVLTDPERYSAWFANVYFGTGDNVLRKKP